MSIYNEFDAIRKVHPSVVSTIGDDLFDAEGNSVERNQAAIDAEIAKITAEYNAQQYARDRVSEYPSIGDQLDALFHAGVFPEEMAAQIQAVKDKYPKGGA
jgi:hypothetical protein